jgi:hypothetical protein
MIPHHTFVAFGLDHLNLVSGGKKKEEEAMNDGGRAKQDSEAARPHSIMQFEIDSL